MNYSSADKIKRVRLALKYSRYDFGRLLHLPEQAIEQFETGKAEPPDEVQQILHSVVGLSLDWWHTGQGKTFTDAARARCPPLGRPRDVLPGDAVKTIQHITDDLFRLDDLRSQGVITESEFQQLKLELLSLSC